MGDLIKDEVVVKPGEPAPEPKDEEIPEEVVRKVLKAKFGEDDPEAFRTKIREAEEIRGAIPTYQRLLDGLTAEIEEARRPRQPEPKVPVADDDEETLAQQARLNPYAVIKKLMEKQRKESAAMAAMAEERGFKRAQGATLADKYGERLRAEWPEAYDDKHELSQTAARIFHQEMSDFERRQPHGFYAAAERAAARLGLAPKSRRKAEAKETRDTREFSGQNVGGGPKRVKDDGGDEPELTAKEKQRLIRMGIDEKTYRIAKKARAEKKDVRVEDKG